MKIILLAAGKGTRMNGNIPKALVPLAGKTLVEHVLTAINESKIDPEPIVVIGHQAEMVRNHLKNRAVKFVHQEPQLGTGHAVMSCRFVVDPKENVLVLYADCALIKAETICSLAEAFQNEADCVMAMVTYTVPNFSVYQGQFQRFGRIIRNKNNQVVAIREAKDCSQEELEIREVNPAFYVFKGDWLWRQLPLLSNDNAQSEYYLTDLVERAIINNQKVVSILGKDLKEAVGINTPEQLFYTKKILKK